MSTTTAYRKSQGKENCMLDIYRVRTRIQEIRKRVIELEKDYKGLAKEKFVKDAKITAAAERNLQVAIQACIDIGNHIVAALGLERPVEETAEVFNALGNEEIIPEDFVDTMKKMTGYRNILVHGYLVVDANKTYEYIQNNLGDFSAFAEHIEIFIEKFEKKK